MPEGVTIIGEGQMEAQQDKSTALVLGPKSCLNLNRKDSNFFDLIFAYTPSSWVYYPAWRSQVYK
jgi:hypothetical protein